MKRFLYFLSVIVIASALNTKVHAQNLDVTASANILVELTYEAVADLNFGDLESDFTSAELDPTGTTHTGLSGTAGTDYTAGRFLISGDGTQNVTVTLGGGGTVTLSHGSSADEITLTPSLSALSGEFTNDFGGAVFTSGTNIALSEGKATIWVGGSLAPVDNDGTTGLAAGLYQNTSALTLTIDYSL